MISSAFASVLIALAVTAGAIPLFKRLLQASTSSGSGGEVRAGGSLVAGASMLFGVFISLFYLDSSAGSVMELHLGGLFLVLVGGWLGLSRVKNSDNGGGFGFELIASVLVGLALMLAMPHGPVQWAVGTVALAAMVMPTPAAVSFLSNSPLATPALPAGLVLIQLLLLALLNAFGGADSSVSAHAGDFRVIALPMIGALIGALIYLSRMPWRAHANISTGVATRLCLGLVVTWGAVGMGMGQRTGEGGAAALAWILAVPVFELVRRFAVVALANAVRPNAGLGLARASLGHSPTSMCAFALILGGIGIGLWHLEVPDAWSVLALLPAFLLYSVTPWLLPSLSTDQSPSIVDAQG